MVQPFGADQILVLQWNDTTAENFVIQLVQHMF